MYCRAQCRVAGLAAWLNSADHFWERVDRAEEGCWRWLAAVGKDGYGHVVYDRGRHTGAHRRAWELTYGTIPAGLWVLHTCDVRVCCRPSHLYLGTLEDNTLDIAARERTARGDRRAGAKLTTQQVLDIRARAAGGEGYRVLGRAFGVDASSIRDIVTRHTWRHI